MGKLSVLFSLCLSMFVFFTKAQTPLVLPIVHERTIAGNFSRFHVDNLGNFYVLLSNNIQIEKLGNNGDSLQLSDNLNQYGNIYSIDVSNPLKLLVYYKDFSTALMLDRFLNTVNTVDLRQSGVMQASAVASSYDSQIWVYDEQNAQIKKLDANANITFTSTDLRAALDEAPSPSKIIDNNGQLYLYDKNMGWLLFDYYGGFKKKVEYKNWEDVSVMNNILFGREGGTLWMYDPKKFIAQPFTTSINIDFQKIKQLLITGNKIYTLNSEGIDVYDIQQ
ncbi:MAG TPA: hypothetical protein VGB84_02815 [Arachidicoccus sp.]